MNSPTASPETPHWGLSPYGRGILPSVTGNRFTKPFYEADPRRMYPLQLFNKTLLSYEIEIKRFEFNFV